MDAIILSDERQIPATPTIAYAAARQFPVDGLAFKIGAVASSQGNLIAFKWRVAATTEPKSPDFDPAVPRKYEIEPAWQSGELKVTTRAAVVRPPAEAKLQPGTHYRARARVKDDSGRWSHWSAPARFVTAGSR